MGLKNVVVMIPLPNSRRAAKVMEVMKEYGLVRGENELELYLMAEIPSNILMAEEFAVHIDGFIGSNDLTQLTLGLDRDSALVAHLYDERTRGEKNARNAYKIGKKKVGICKDHRIFLILRSFSRPRH
jgi:pyruvate,water dikinase